MERLIGIVLLMLVALMLLGFVLAHFGRKNIGALTGHVVFLQGPDRRRYPHGAP